MKKSTFTTTSSFSIFAGALAVVMVSAFSSPAAAQSADDVSLRLKAVEAENAALAKENAALRERIKLAAENAKLRDRLHHLEAAGPGAAPAETSAAPSAAVVGALAAQPALYDDASLPTAGAFGAMPQAPSWNGFYAGFNLGYGWADSTVNFSPNDPLSVFLFGALEKGQPPATPIGSSGMIGGFQLGYNWEVSKGWLVGAEADFNWADVNGSASRTENTGFLVPFPFTSNVDEQLDWFGTVRARLGYLPVDNLLAYVTGGFAYGRVTRDGTYINNGVTTTLTAPPFEAVCAASAPCFTGSSSNVDIGWAAGGGFEYAVSSNVSIRAEYLYMSLAGRPLTETAINGGGAIPSSFNANYSHTDFNFARLGLNFRL